MIRKLGWFFLAPLVLLPLLLYLKYDGSPDAFISALLTGGNFSTEKPLGTVREINIKVAHSLWGHSDDLLIYEIVAEKRTMVFSCPVSAPVFCDGLWAPSTPEKVATDLRRHVELWKKTFAEDQAGPPSPDAQYGPLTAVVLAFRADGATSKRRMFYFSNPTGPGNHRIWWQMNGILGIKLQTVYAEGDILHRAVRHYGDGFELPIAGAGWFPHSSPVLIDSIPINEPGVRQHFHINVNYYRGP